MKERFKAVPAVYLFLKRDGKLLLTLRQNTGYKDGEYMVPSGHAEAGETLREACCREVMEEVGVAVSPEDLRLVHTMYRRADDGSDSARADFFFEAASWRGEPRNCEPHKCREVAWFPEGRLPPNTVRYLCAAFAAAGRGERLSESGWHES